MSYDLALFPFVAQLSAAARRRLAKLSVRDAPPSMRLISRGDPCAGAYFIIGGAMRVYYLTAGGREATLYNVEPGGTCVLALTATFRQEAYPAWVESGRAGSRFVVVSAAEFRALFDGEPAFREFVFGVLSGRILQLLTTLEELGSTQVEQRLASFLLRESTAGRPVKASQSALAAELGTVREVVARALRELRRRGLVHTRRGVTQVLDRKGLEATARSDGSVT